MSSQDEFFSLFAPESVKPETAANTNPWKVLLVDDEPNIHAVLRLALQDVDVEHRPLLLLDARSGEEAKARLTEYPDIALILLDVVMETEQAGLELVHYIRKELGNRAIQIVVVTGQPGYAPQREVVQSYEIDGYRLKSELTADKIFVSVYAALRTHQVMCELESKRKQLELSSESSSIYARNMNKRVREISCLRDITTLAFKNNKSVESILDSCVRRIPEGWFDPSRTCARIRLDDKIFETPNLKETEWSLLAVIPFTTATSGIVEVFYLSDGSETTSNPFLDEEHDLIESIANQLAQSLERRWAEEKVNELNRNLEQKVSERTANLILARNAAEAASKAKSTFLTSMSHELRTPLNAILGFSCLMRRDGQLRPEQCNNLDIINRSGEHLLTLINDILEIAKIEAGKTQLNIAPFDLGALVRDVTDMMELRASAKGLQLLIDTSSQFPRYINGDEARLRQIFINLIGNAIKFTEQGGVTLRLGTKQNTIAHLIIEIEDSGLGLSAKDQQQLFQPFMQFGKQPGDNKGTGLGLSITQQFVQLMGGSISVESTIGKGSLFRVDLPLSEVKAAELLQPQETEKGEVIGLAADQPVYRILIVEDQRENHLLLSRLMQLLGFEVKLATDGKQGVQLFQSWQPHLIFMDIHMPEMDGVEATTAIRQLPGGKDVKIIAVTASAFMEQRDEMMPAGMDDFVSKPYRFSEIYESLGRQLGVQYIYANVRDNVETSPPVALTAAMLKVLPAALRNELREVLVSLEEERIRTTIEQIAAHDNPLSKTLSQLASNYDYPTILNALQESP